MKETAITLGVLVQPTCAVCQGHGEDRHEGHEFESMPRPLLPAEDTAQFSYWADGLWRGCTATDRVSGKTAAVKGRPDLAGSEVMRGFDWDGALRGGALLALARVLCPHVDHQVWAGVGRFVAGDGVQQGRIPEATGFHLDLRVWCADCGERFVFVGPMQLGVSPRKPTVDFQGTTLAAPLRPLLAPEGWGENRPGAIGRWVK